MRKLFLICFAMLIIIPVFAKAETCDTSKVIIDSINIVDATNSSIEKTAPTINGTKINLDLNLSEVGDFIKYRIVIKNNSKSDFIFDKEKININSDYILYDLTMDDEETDIKADSSKTVYLTISYKTAVDASKFQDGAFADISLVSVDLFGLETNIKNPDTGINNPLLRIVIFLVAVGILFFVLKRRKYNRLMIVLLGLFILPVTIYAICKCNLSLDVTANILNTNYMYTTSYNNYNINDVINSGDPVYTDYNQAINGFSGTFFIRHVINSENAIAASYVGYQKDNKIYYIQGGNSDYYENNKKDLLIVFDEDDCTELDGNFICEDYNSELKVIIGNDGYASAQSGSNEICQIYGDGLSYCIEGK